MYVVRLWKKRNNTVISVINLAVFFVFFLYSNRFVGSEREHWHWLFRKFCHINFSRHRWLYESFRYSDFNHKKRQNQSSIFLINVWKSKCIRFRYSMFRIPYSVFAYHNRINHSIFDCNAINLHTHTSHHSNKMEGFVASTSFYQSFDFTLRNATIQFSSVFFILASASLRRNQNRINCTVQSMFTYSSLEYKKKKMGSNGITPTLFVVPLLYRLNEHVNSIPYNRSVWYALGNGWHSVSMWQTFRKKNKIQFIWKKKDIYFVFWAQMPQQNTNNNAQNGIVRWWYSMSRRIQYNSELTHK